MYHNENYVNNTNTLILSKLFNIDNSIILDYKDIDLQIGYQEITFYLSFEFDDDM